MRRLVEAAIEEAEEALLLVVAFLDRLEERAAKRGRQRKREETGEQDRHDHGQRELLVDDADGAREEGHRHEHCRQHQRDADDGAGNLPHRLACRFLRRQLFLGHDAFDVFDDNDRVIDENADRQNHREHRQHVDREPGRIHDGTGAEQRHRHDQGRNDGVTDVLQEDEHDDEDENHRLDQRMNDLLDRHRHERAGVVRDLILYAGGEIP
ncbi:hypothetical protein D3C73_903630 [compost metagenome]